MLLVPEWVTEKTIANFLPGRLCVQNDTEGRQECMHVCALAQEHKQGKYVHWKSLTCALWSSPVCLSGVPLSAFSSSALELCQGGHTHRSQIASTHLLARHGKVEAQVLLSEQPVGSLAKASQPVEQKQSPSSQRGDHGRCHHLHSGFSRRSGRKP